MKTTTLGNSGVQVSSLCLGTMYFGSKVDEETSFALLDQYWDAGGRFLDTANVYARWITGFQGGESEALLGRWLAARGYGGKAFIASKVGFPTPVDDLKFGAARSQIERAVEASLRRLGVERIDLYYVHGDDRQAPLAERLEAFTRLRDAGKIGEAGASNFRAWRLEEAHGLCSANGWLDYCCVQQRFSYVRAQRGAYYDPHVEADDAELDYYRNRGLTLLAYSPLLSGAYTRSDRSFPNQYEGPDTDARMGALAKAAEATGATANQVVLAWMLQSDPPVIPVIGMSTSDQLGELLGAIDVKLSPEQCAELSDAGLKPAIHENAQQHLPPGAKRG